VDRLIRAIMVAALLAMVAMPTVAAREAGTCSFQWRQSNENTAPLQEPPVLMPAPPYGAEVHLTASGLAPDTNYTQRLSTTIPRHKDFISSGHVTDSTGNLLIRYWLFAYPSTTVTIKLTAGGAPSATCSFEVVGN
jgi:hypothetical protein